MLQVHGLGVIYYNQRYEQTNHSNDTKESTTRLVIQAEKNVSVNDLIEFIKFSSKNPEISKIEQK